MGRNCSHASQRREWRKCQAQAVRDYRCFRADLQSLLREGGQRGGRDERRAVALEAATDAGIDERLKIAEKYAMGMNISP